MVQKKKKAPVKKPAVKKLVTPVKAGTAAVKKPAPAKKAAKAVAKPAPVKVPVMAAATAPKQVVAAQKKCSMICWKKVVIFLLGVAIGAGAILATTGHRKQQKGMKFDRMFNQEGCLVVSRIRSPERIERLRARGLDVEGCITREQFFGERMNRDGERARPEGKRGPRGEGHRGQRGEGRGHRHRAQ